MFLGLKKYSIVEFPKSGRFGLPEDYLVDLGHSHFFALAYQFSQVTMSAVRLKLSESI